MANIYDVASAIQQPNIPGAIQQGIQTARQNALGNIAVQQAQQQQADTQTLRGLAPQIVAGDPTAYAQAAAINPDQANNYQSAADQQLSKLRGAINYIDQQKTPQAKEAAYQNAVRPYLAAIGAAQGKVPPATFAEAEPMMEAARGQIATLAPPPGQKDGGFINVGAGGAVWDPVSKQPVFQNQQVKPQLVTGVDGQSYWATPNGPATPIRINSGAPATAQGNSQASGQAITASSPSLPNAAAIANAALDHGATHEQAVGIANAAGGGTQKIALAVDPATGRFKDVTDGSAQIQPAGGDQFLSTQPKRQTFTQLSPDEVAAAGLPKGTVAQRGSDGKIDVIAKGTETGNIVAPGDTTKNGDEYLASLPPSTARLVKAIAEGNKAAPSASSRSPEAQQLLQAVYQYDPSASDTNLPVRTATQKSFTSGADAKNLMALAQFAAHAEQLSEMIPKLSGIALPFVGTAVNSAINNASDPYTGNLTAWNQKADAVAHEGRAAFAGASGGTLAELEKQAASLGGNSSIQQKQAALASISDLVRSRIQLAQDKYDKGMGTVSKPLEIVSPHVREALDSLAAIDHQGKPSTQSASGQASLPTTSQPRAVNPQTGHAIVWNGSAWVDE